ncbi:AT-rich interactive domain-containing protein 5B-like [Acipenser ruthenus]|uniref:AT-rich interactive domain-containing protein 5B-like n=1 Tax=Acipenser ruthenus TaxID=7906 RepID=UPI00145B3EC0|nr:AT-rich interactive domain-containing protein 5B-like [Acipenser ruthenus]
MERSAVQWLGAPCCARGTYAFYKSFSCRGAVAARCPAVWSLGEFYFVRCGPKEPVCLAELTLLWEDQAQHHLLASSRLYFLPEDTPKGRSDEHGEDEVLAVSKKIVIRVEDLVKWACPEPSGWKRNARKDGAPDSIGILLSDQPQGASVQSADSAQGVSVKVLSYLQYCRFRSMHKRMQGVAHASSLKDPQLLALGGIRVTSHNTRILYCRDTFNHPTLESNTSIWTEFGCTSLSMKGRPRKRKGREGRGAELGPPDQSEAWIERMKDTVTGSVEEQQDWGALGGQWLPQPEEQHFLEQLHSFMRGRSTPICKVPHLGFKKIDLFLLYSVVKTMGGYETVTEQKLWKHVYNELGGSPGSTSAATCTRRHYERLILAYDRYLKGAEQPAPLPKPRAGAAADEKGKPVKRTAAQPPQKAKKDPVVVKQESRVEVKVNGRPKRARRRAGCASKDSSKQSVRKEQGQGREPDSSAGVRIQDQQTSSSPALGVLALGLQDDSIPPLAALQKLHPAVGGFSLPQGLSPLDVLRSRLGLGPSSEGPGSVSQEPRKTLVLLQPTAGDPGKEPGDPNPALKPHGAPFAAGQGRFPMAPLRIIPLDIDCSLQVQQLMKSSLGHAQLSCFTKKLSEALAQDLSKTPRPRESVPNTEEQQAVPLNLSKRAKVKRPADCAEPPPPSPYQPSLLHSSYPLYTPQPSQASQAGTAKKLKTEPGPQEQAPAGIQNGRLGSNPAEAEEQPADLSSPRRARAALRDGEERAGEPGLNLVSRPTSITLIPQGDAPSDTQETREPAATSAMLEDRHSAGDPCTGSPALQRALPTRPGSRGSVAAGSEEQGGASPAAYPLYHFRGRQVHLGESGADCLKQVSSEMSALLSTASGALQNQHSWALAPHGR